MSRDRLRFREDIVANFYKIYSFQGDDLISELVGLDSGVQNNNYLFNHLFAISDTQSYTPINR